MKLSSCALVVGSALLNSVGLAQTCDPHFTALGPVDGAVTALQVFDDGSGLSLFAGGGFVIADGAPVLHVARWDGAAWSPLAQGVDGGGIEAARALAVFDNGSGPALYVGGALTSAGLGPANHIARWNGEAWNSLGDGVDNTVRALAVFDEDGDGPKPAALFAAGAFLNAGGQPASNIARWDGSSWSAVGGGVDAQDGLVRGLLVHDDGSGPALYATGTFVSIGGVACNNIARWDGSVWSPLGDGLTGGAGIALTGWDEGEGTNLYAGGTFTQAGGQPAMEVARWNGSEWSALGDGLAGTNVRALAGYDDGTGPALYAGGEIPGGGFFRWNGGSWQPVGGGTDGYVIVLLPATAPQNGLYLGGGFANAGGQAAPNAALWAGCPRCPPDCDGSGELDLFDFLCFVNLFNVQDAGADCDGDGEFTLFDFLCFVNSFNEGC